MKISFGLKHPPSDPGIYEISYGDAAYSLLLGSPWFAEFRAKYGHLVLVFQELEQELRCMLGYMKSAFEKNGLPVEFEADPKSATFETLIRMFGKQLNASNGSRDLVKRMHQARKYRNRLAHDFTNGESLEYHLSAGGRAKTIDQLNARIDHVVPLVMIVHRIGRAYAAEVGITTEVLDWAVRGKIDALGIDEDQLIQYMTGEAQEPNKKKTRRVDLSDL